MSTKNAAINEVSRTLIKKVVAAAVGTLIGEYVGRKLVKKLMGADPNE